MGSVGRSDLGMFSTSSNDSIIFLERGAESAPSREVTFKKWPNGAGMCTYLSVWMRRITQVAHGAFQTEQNSTLQDLDLNIRLDMDLDGLHIGKNLKT